jgi:hypothetical protein
MAYQEVLQQIPTWLAEHALNLLAAVLTCAPAPLQLCKSLHAFPCAAPCWYRDVQISCHGDVACWSIKQGCMCRHTTVSQSVCATFPPAQSQLDCERAGSIRHLCASAVVHMQAQSLAWPGMTGATAKCVLLPTACRPEGVSWQFSDRQNDAAHIYRRPLNMLQCDFVQ